MKSSGFAKFKSMEEYLEWYQHCTYAEINEENSFFRKIDQLPREYKTIIDQAAKVKEQWFNVFRFTNIISTNTHEAHFRETIEKCFPDLKSYCLYGSQYEDGFKVAYWDGEDAMLYIGNPNSPIYVPCRFLELLPETDYSGMTISEIKAISGISPDANTQEIIPTQLETSLTKTSITEEINGCTQKLSEMEDELHDIRSAKKDGLRELQEQINKMMQELNDKKSAMIEEMNRRIEEMEEKKFQLEAQIYMLDSQIYSILCYSGEIVKFSQIKSGKPASVETPVVIYQKLRFLDEDLGRMTSIYNIDFNKVRLFEDFLANSPIAIDTFVPNEKCVSLVRLSRTGTYLFTGENVNFLERFKVYHGRTVGIVVRNGENIYVGWTDDSRVHIDDDLIIGRVITEVSPVQESEILFESDRKQAIKETRKNQMAIADGIVSRSFVYNVLQGAVDRSEMITLPKGVTLSKESEFVKYSMADNCLEDNRFGSFAEIVAKCNEVVKIGDPVLTMSRIIPKYMRHFGSNSYYGQRTWENPRGRGEKNRTHDCRVEDCAIYQINLIEDDQIFISVEKGDAWSGSGVRANFELFKTEFINLAYMNSVWLSWVINTKKIGDWYVCGNISDYAYSIRYLNKAMEFVRKREKNEKAFIDEIDDSICEDAEWPLKLSEWKMTHGVRTMNAFQAKRFVKWIKSK